MSDLRQWRFTVTDFHAETFPRKGTKVGLQITDGEKTVYRSTVIAEDRTRGLSHDDVVRLAWDEVKEGVGQADVEGRTFVVGDLGTAQPLAPSPQRMFEIDTIRELERLRGQLVNDTLTFDALESEYRVKPIVLRYYTNLVLRQDGRFRFGTIDLTGGTSIPNVQLVTDLIIRDQSGTELRRPAREIVRITVLTA